jgi:SAM-dependent methyltransferase
MKTRPSRPMKAAIRRLRDAARAGLLKLGIGDPLLPPRSLARVGSGDFRRTGEAFLRYFIDLGGLRPDEAVLDVGCGVGRMAVPLTRYLRAPGHYRGFDPMRDCIDWCRRQITPRFPHFEFTSADVINPTYNPRGSVAPLEFRFPYADESFDFAVLTSVFTHVRAAHVVHYLGELRRVLRCGGRVLLTAFLLNAESRALLAAGRGERRFAHALGDCWADDPSRPEDAVAFEECWLLRHLSESGFVPRGPIQYGAWPGRERFLSRQDVVVAARRSDH